MTTTTTPLFETEMRIQVAAAEAGIIDATVITSDHRMARAIVRLVDELRWLNTIVLLTTPGAAAASPDTHVCAVKLAAALTLESATDLLAMPSARSLFRREAWWTMKMSSARWQDFVKQAVGQDVPANLAQVVAEVAERLEPILERLP